MSNSCWERITDCSTDEILDRFGSDPRKPRVQNLSLRDGEMFCGERSGGHAERRPRYSAITSDVRLGPLYNEYMQMDTGVLTFNCYLSEAESDVFCEDQVQRIRPMKIIYHLADDTLSLIEPPVSNSGMLQGRVFSRLRVPRTDAMLGRDFIHWSDLNVGRDIELFSRVYRIASCDQKTKDFLERNGIKLGAEEDVPMDPWTKRRAAAHIQQPPLPPNEGEGFVNAPPRLHLLACWLDSSTDFSGTRQKRTFCLSVYTADDTVCITETTKGAEGQMFLRRMRLPCPPKRSRRYYRSWELRPGVWVDVFSRPMFIYGCEGNVTKQFIQQQFGEFDFSENDQILKEGPPPEHWIEVPEVLRFVAQMVSENSPFSDMQFIVCYHTGNGEVDIAEEGKRRKWSQGRAFLEGIHSHHYGIDHFNVGKTLTFYKWSFKLIEADNPTVQFLRAKEERDDIS